MGGGAACVQSLTSCSASLWPLGKRKSTFWPTSQSSTRVVRSGKCFIHLERRLNLPLIFARSDARPSLADRSSGSSFALFFPTAAGEGVTKAHRWPLRMGVCAGGIEGSGGGSGP